MKPTPVPARSSLHETKQESVRESIGLTASRLFLEQGFEGTTIEDIAKAAAIGRRTFFRYFETKEAVVLWRFDQFARRALAVLEGRPAREPPFLALQAALIEASEFYNQDPAHTIKMLELTAHTPSLWAQQLLQRDRWKGWFAATLRKRTRASERSLMPELMASIGLEATAIAVIRWVAEPTVHLSSLIESAFNACGKVLHPPKPR